jgi:hypothetical protein
MQKALRYRLFRMGKMPESLAAAASGADVLLASEGLPVHNRVKSLRIPGAKVGTGFRTASGAIVILPGRLLASIGRYEIADTHLGADTGQQTLELTSDGVWIRFDVASVRADGSGTVEVHYKLPLDAQLLSQLPATSVPVTLTHAYEALLYPWHGSYAG